MHIVDDEQRRDRPQSPCALRVPAVRGHLRRWRSSTMYTDIACVAPPCICPRSAGTRPLLILGQAPRRYLPRRLEGADYAVLFSACILRCNALYNKSVADISRKLHVSAFARHESLNGIVHTDNLRRSNLHETLCTHDRTSACCWFCFWRRC